MVWWRKSEERFAKPDYVYRGESLPMESSAKREERLAGKYIELREKEMEIALKYIPESSKCSYFKEMVDLVVGFSPHCSMALLRLAAEAEAIIKEHNLRKTT